MTTPDTPTTEEPTMDLLTVTYAGRRYTTKGKLMHAWAIDGYNDDQDPTDVALFAKASGSVIGGIYTCHGTIDRTATGEVIGVTLNRDSLTYTGERIPNEETILAWRTATMTDSTRDERAKLERNHARNNEVRALCQPLRQLLDKQVGYARRAALLAVILSELNN